MHRPLVTRILSKITPLFICRSTRTTHTVSTRTSLNTHVSPRLITARVL
jgi:hypothetical protein